MARPDLTNEQIEHMGRENPGSAAEYLRLRREELAAEEEAAKERRDYLRFEHDFVRGGTEEGARAAYDRRCNEEAERATQAADKSAAFWTRRSIASKL